MSAMRDSGDDNAPPAAPRDDDRPHFGRLLAVLALAILIIVAVTLASERYLA